jgi:hypothetical protein
MLQRFIRRATDPDDSLVLNTLEEVEAAAEKNNNASFAVKAPARN